MARYTFAGFDAFSVVLTLPRHGLWHADVELNANDVGSISGQQPLIVGNLTLRGSASGRAGIFKDHAKLRVIGGASGLSGIAVAKGYQNATFGRIFTDVLTAAGEKVSPTCDASVMGIQFPKWSTLARPLNLTLEGLVQRAPTGTLWRTLPDGTFWVGSESWPDSGLVKGRDYQLVMEEANLQRQVLGVESPSLLPGTLLMGRRVSSVTHIATSKRIRTVAWLERTP